MRLRRKTKLSNDRDAQAPLGWDGHGSKTLRTLETDHSTPPEGMSARVLIAMARSPPDDRPPVPD